MENEIQEVNKIEEKINKNKGKPKSDEWKQKHSEAMKKAHARKKEIKQTIQE